MSRKEVIEKIITYIKEKERATIGDVYMNFHMMNKGNEFSKEGDLPISAKQVTEYLNELVKNEKIISRGEYFYLK